MILFILQVTSMQNALKYPYHDEKNAALHNFKIDKHSK